MKTLYLAFVKNSSGSQSGVIKKLKGQFEVFKVHFTNCYYTTLTNNTMQVFDSDNIKVEEIESDRFFIKVISRRKSFYKQLFRFIEKENIESIYIRYNGSDMFLLNFIKNAKSIGIKVFIEIPTYPYKAEILKKTTRIADDYYSKKLNKYVNNIITYSEDNEIFGIPTIKIGNGIDVNSIKVNQLSPDLNSVNLIGVANVSYWHGYDRIIEGLGEYYKTNYNKEVYFHIVGDGVELESLKQLTNKLNMQKYVLFHGARNGYKLDEVFKNCHLGIGALGGHRKGLYKDSALKNREYCSRGVPFIIASEDNDFPENFKFVYRVSKNDSPINISGVLNFYEGIESENFVKKMRSYAEVNLTWKAKMKPVINAMKEHIDK